MGIATNGNAWWNDVLKASSPSITDIDWRPVKQELTDKVLLPFLGDQYGRVLDAGQAARLPRGVCDRYFESEFPSGRRR